jgi:DNA-binding NtrC family response regulator
LADLADDTPERRLLIIEDDADVATAARLVLRRSASRIETLADPRGLAAALERLRPAALLLDMNFGPGQNAGEAGLALLRSLPRPPAGPAVVAMTAYGEVELAVRALKLGASDFVVKPWANPRLVAAIDAAFAVHEAARAQSEGSAAVPAAGSAPGRAGDVASGLAASLLGSSLAMSTLRRRVHDVAAADTPLLLLGEPGSGRRHLAATVHRASPQASGPLRVLDLAAGGVTGADLAAAVADVRAGGAGGSVVLHGLDHLNAAAQAGLLALLEADAALPLLAAAGGPAVRWIATSTLDDAALLAGRSPLRRELVACWQVLVLRLPRLVDRAQDIPLLAGHFLARFARRHKRPQRPLADAAAAALLTHGWPGHVAELQAACERAVLLGEGPSLRAEDFGLARVGERAGPGGAPVFAAAAAQPPPSAAAAAADGSLELGALERAALLRALAQAGGNMSQAARLLGLSRAALYRRLDKHGLPLGRLPDA